MSYRLHADWTLMVSVFSFFKSNVWLDSKTVPMLPTPWYSYPCKIPSHVVPGLVCATQRIWQQG